MEVAEAMSALTGGAHFWCVSIVIRHRRDPRDLRVNRDINVSLEPMNTPRLRIRCYLCVVVG